jgi:hypothetical protein
LKLAVLTDQLERAIMASPDELKTYEEGAVKLIELLVAKADKDKVVIERSKGLERCAQA